MAEKEVNFGKIFRNYIKANKKGDRVNIPVLCGSPSVFVNCYLTRGEALDLIDAIQGVLRNIERKEEVSD